MAPHFQRPEVRTAPARFGRAASPDYSRTWRSRRSEYGGLTMNTALLRSGTLVLAWASGREHARGAGSRQQRRAMLGGAHARTTGTPCLAACHAFLPPPTGVAMDPTAFDALARSFASSSTRRRLLALLAALPLGGVLSTLSDDEAAAERPHQRLRRRTQQRNRKQRNSARTRTRTTTTAEQQPERWRWRPCGWWWPLPRWNCMRAGCRLLRHVPLYNVALGATAAVA